MEDTYRSNPSNQINGNNYPDRNISYPQIRARHNIDSRFCNNECNNYFWGCTCSLVALLFLALIIVTVNPITGLLLAALAPSTIILLFVQRYYANEVTEGQMIGMKQFC